ncbi:secretory phospholipase A2 receptor [Xiphophorus hellerii]|uniref:secretory phospholipase A2 receptor n=1 Tax=Xiphophorus hellerii TaxID=8084 RepID=UPI0013B3703F|nr:secretory phospholipase A2 receptor-like [Xiphophorus hellerii]
MVKVLFLVLCSGILQFSFAANRLRYFSYTENDLNWTKAKQHCVENGGSLLSLFDEEDEMMMINFTSSTEGPGFWLGLKKKDNNTLFWSNGEAVQFNNSTVNITNVDQLCEAFEKGSWMGFNCSEKKAFMCENGGNFTLVHDVEKNWCQAMQHCRTHFTDLASIMNEQQNDDLRQKSQEKNVWIGLQHDYYEWADNSCSTYGSKFKVDQRSPEQCISLNNDGIKLTWNQMKCDNIKPVICYKGRVRIRVIKEPKTWEDALDYCKTRHSRLLWIEDEEDQKAVEQWLNFIYADSSKRLWIGLRQSSVFGFWIWSDRIVNYKNWENGKQPEMPLSNHCGVIDAETYKWSDESCKHNLPFLCEEDIIYMKTSNYSFIHTLGINQQ